MIRAVVFDFDGVVLDTETAEFQAWADTFAAYGGELTLAEVESWIGTSSSADAYSMLVDRATMPVPSREEVRAQKRARAFDLLGDAEPLPGVVQWLDDAADAGLGIAIASSSPPDWIDEHLERVAMRHRFPHISCQDGTLPGKPEPDLYLAACRALEVEPSEAIALEDSPNGVTAARRAGLYCVAIPRGITSGLDLSAADVLVESLADFTLADALRLANA